MQRSGPGLRNDQKLLLAACAVAVLAWFVPQARPALYPLVLLNTHLHELAHAVAALVTGGFPQHILVYANGSGVTPIMGGNIIVVASAGYVGTAVLGGLLIVGSARAEGARRSMSLLGVLLLLTVFALVRGDGVGIASGLLWAIALLAGGKWLSGQSAIFAGQFLGAQLCLTSAEAFSALIRVGTQPGAHSDAAILAAHTPVPALGWAVGWFLLSAWIVVMAFRRAWNPPPARLRRGRP